MMELERREKEVNRMGRQVEELRMKEVALNGFGSFACESETSEDMFKQMETARQEELARLTKDKLKAESSSHYLQSNAVTKQKVREMLERKKREINLRNVTNSSAGSSLKDAFLKKTDVQKGGNNLFLSDEENEPVAFAGKDIHYEDPTSLENGDLTCVLGEDIPDQERIWERIQRDRREEEERISGMKHNEVVQEQQEILRKIQEQNLARKKEEDLTLKLIAEMSLSDQRQQQQQLRSNEASAVYTPYQAAYTPYQAASPPYQAHPAAAAAKLSDVGHVGEDWRVVGARVKEKVASLKIAAELDNNKRETAAMDEGEGKGGKLEDRSRVGQQQEGNS